MEEEIESICVGIRVRPLNEREKKNQDVSILKCLPKLNAISVTDRSGKALSGSNNVFQSDHVLDENCTNGIIYERLGRRIIDSALNGINGTIFAYGQTSSGKTHTTCGTEMDPGILPLAVEHIFETIEESVNRDFLLRVSYVEIYNEIIKDLLDGKGSSLKIREDPRKGVYVECVEEIITEYETILTLLNAGNKIRTVGQTAMNEQSSRSHSIFRIVVESKVKSEDEDGAILVASLNIVDLAGSESVRHTAAEGIRQREASNINRSLLTLSRVINSLGQGSSQSAPFRDSKLTRLLQKSLAGNTRTLMLCCVTPSDRHVEETRSTLQFASRAKQIQTAVAINEVLDDQAKLKKMSTELAKLKMQLSAKIVADPKIDVLQAEKESLTMEKRKQEQEISRLKSLILHGEHPQTPLKKDKNAATRRRRRESWCPSGAPLTGAMPFISPNPQPRKRNMHNDVEPVNSLLKNLNACSVKDETIFEEKLDLAKDKVLELENSASVHAVISELIAKIEHQDVHETCNDLRTQLKDQCQISETLYEQSKNLQEKLDKESEELLFQLGSIEEEKEELIQTLEQAQNCKSLLEQEKTKIALEGEKKLALKNQELLERLQQIEQLQADESTLAQKLYCVETNLESYGKLCVTLRNELATLKSAQIAIDNQFKHEFQNIEDKLEQHTNASMQTMAQEEHATALLQKENEQLVKRYHSLEFMCESMKSENEELQKFLGASNNEASALKTQSEETLSIVQQKDEELANLQTQIVEWEEKFNAMRDNSVVRDAEAQQERYQETENWEKKLEALNFENDQKAARISELEKISSDRTELDEAERNFEVKLENQSQQLLKEIDEWKIKCEHLDGLVQDSNVQISNAYALNGNWQEKHDLLASKLQEREAAIEEHTLNVEHSQEKIDGLEEKIKELSEQVAQNAKTYENSLSEAQTISNNQAQEHGEIQVELEMSNKILEDKLGSLIEQHTTDLQSWKDKCKDLSVRLDDMSSTIEAGTQTLEEQLCASKQDASEAVERLKQEHQQRIEHWQASEKGLKDELAAKLSALEETQSMLSSFQEQDEHHKKILLEKDTALENMEKSLSIIQKSEGDLQNELSQQVELLQEYETQLEEQRTQDETRQSEITEQKELLKYYEEQFESQTRSTAESASSISALNSKLEQYEQEIEALKRTDHELRATTKFQKDAVDRLEEELRTYALSTNQLQADVDEKQGLLDAYKIDLDSERQSAIDLTRENAEKDQMVQNLEEKLAKLSNVESATKAELQQACDKVSTQENEIASFATLEAELGDSISNQKQIIADLEGQLQCIAVREASKNSHISELESLLKDYESQIKTLMESESVLRSNAAGPSELVMNLQEKLQYMENACAEQKSTLTTMQAKFENLQNENEQQRTQLSTSVQNLEEREAMCNDSAEKLSQAMSNLEQIRSDLHAAKASENDLKSALKIAESRSKEEINARRRSFDSDLSLWKSKYSEAVEEIESIKIATAEDQDLFNSTFKEMKQSLSEELQKANEQIDSLTKKLNAALADYNSTSAGMDSEMEKLRNKMDKEVSSRRQIENDLQALQSKYESAISEKENLESEYDSKVELLNSQLNELKLSTQDEKSWQGEKERLEDELERVSMQIMELENEREEESIARVSSNRAWLLEKKEILQDHEGWEKEKALLLEKVSQSEIALAGMKETLASKEKRIAKLDAVKMTKEHFDKFYQTKQERNRYQAQVQQLQSQLKASSNTSSNNELFTLQEEKDDLLKELENLKDMELKKSADTQTQLDEMQNKIRILEEENLELMMQIKANRKNMVAPPAQVTKPLQPKNANQIASPIAKFDKSTVSDASVLSENEEPSECANQ